MEMGLMIGILFGLGALGGMLHWLLPEAEKTTPKQLIKRMIGGGIAGLFVGSAGFIAIMEQYPGDLAFILIGALPVLGTGYVGVDTVIMAVDFLKKDNAKVEAPKIEKDENDLIDTKEEQEDRTEQESEKKEEENKEE